MPFFQDCYVGCQFYVNRRVISKPVLNWGQWREVTRETRDSGGEYQMWYKMLRCSCLFVCLFMLLFLLQLLFLLLGSNCHPMGKREPSFHSPLESKSIMHLAAFTWSQIPKNLENFLNHASY